MLWNTIWINISFKLRPNHKIARQKADRSPKQHKGSHFGAISVKEKERKWRERWNWVWSWLWWHNACGSPQQKSNQHRIPRGISEISLFLLPSWETSIVFEESGPGSPWRPTSESTWSSLQLRVCCTSCLNHLQNGHPHTGLESSHMVVCLLGLFVLGPSTSVAPNS